MSECLVYDKAVVGRRIQNKRLALGLTQEKLADRLDKSLRFVADIERGAVGVSVETLLSLCSVLMTTPNELLLSESKEPTSDLDWLFKTLTNCPDHARATAVALVRTYLRSLGEGQ